MTLAEISARFLAEQKQSVSAVEAHSENETDKRVMSLLAAHFSGNASLDVLSAITLRDFLARSYVEKACVAKFGSGNAGFDNLKHVDALPEPEAVVDSLARLFEWIRQQEGIDLVQQTSSMLAGLRESIPRALAIAGSLCSWLRNRRGAFSFPEFLTTFEEGGHSQYDIDTPGEVGAIEGFFRIIIVREGRVEAEDLISEARVWPILFPADVVELLVEDYIINLELTRSGEGWHITACGFVYPPGTDV
jgi:hypothetical protein